MQIKCSAKMALKRIGLCLLDEVALYYNDAIENVVKLVSYSPTATRSM